MAKGNNILDMRYFFDDEVADGQYVSMFQIENKRQNQLSQIALSNKYCEKWL
ncbi:MAG: hypothetical protein JKY50_04885 [Oleispira sp.]|nr:hypothetical protein [Oleispira sp.]MBL4880806.1 hypothetical protein [Oleispira sp.]